MAAVTYCKIGLIFRRQERYGVGACLSAILQIPPSRRRVHPCLSTPLSLDYFSVFDNFLSLLTCSSVTIHWRSVSAVLDGHTRCRRAGVLIVVGREI